MKSKFIKKFKTYKKIIRKVITIMRRNDVNLLPSYIAFFILISFLPILTLFFEVIYLTTINNQEILNILKDVLPSNVYTFIIRLVDHNPNNISLLTMSNIVLLFLASRIYQAFRNSYLIIYKIDFKSHLIKDKIISLINTFLLIVLIFVLTLFSMLSSYFYQIIDMFSKELNYLYILLNYYNFVISITLISFVVTFLMYSIPEVKQKVKDIFLGSLFVTIGWIIVSMGLKVYTENYANYETIYKTFGTVIVFITWIYLISYVLVLGIAINKAVSDITTHIKDVNSKNKNEYTERSEI